MNGRKAKLLRRQQTEEHVPDLHMSFGTNRKRRRELHFKVKDRSFTRSCGEKAKHIVQDYRLQRIVWDGSNHERMKIREAFREARRLNAQNANL